MRVNLEYTPPLFNNLVTLSCYIVLQKYLYTYNYSFSSPSILDGITMEKRASKRIFTAVKSSLVCH